METKLLSSIKRAFTLGWKNFSREMGLSFVAIFVLMIAITIAVFIFLIRGVSNLIIENIEKKADITVDFQLTVPEERIFEIRDELSEKFDLNSVDYISRESAKTAFIQKFGSKDAVMESLEEIGNPFPASLKIQANENYTYQQISKLLEESYLDVVYNIDYYNREEVITGIFAVTEGSRKVGIGLSIIIGIVAIMLVYNTIKLAIYNQRDEIRIMRLVGSSNSFIQSSFIVQGLLVGVVGALCSFIFLMFLAVFIPQTYIATLEINLYEYFFSVLPIIILIQLITGVVLGALSSIIATAKYLNNF